jgi:acetoin utilization deacetylase AcuC-like enzyme
MLAYISHPDCFLHDTGPMHPERAARLHAINDAVIASGIDITLQHHDAPLATREQLERVHDAAYVQRIFDVAPEKGWVQLDAGDTLMSPGTLNAALRAAGAGVLGVDLVMSGKATSAFGAVRPPGHHAERAAAMGFCFFNNVAVAAAHALAAHGLERVAIVDFDVHHGNGTEDIFAGDERVLVCSSFQHPFYPFSGHNSPAANLIDIPLDAGTRGEDYMARVADLWYPAIREFAPQSVFISAGFDGHADDDMSGIGLVERDYAAITRELVSIANEHAQGRIVSMLEGGYELASLGRSVVAHLNALLG